MAEGKTAVDVDIIHYIGGFGVYQVTLFFLLASCIYLGSIDSIMMNFIGGFQDHWCAVPQLANFSHAQQKYIAIPYDSDDEDYSSCEQFPLNWADYSYDDFISWNRSERTGDLEPKDYVDCTQGWVFDTSQYITTIGSEMGLVCDKRWQVELISSIYMLGRLIGAMSCGFASDMFGRKLSMMAFHTVRLAGALTCVYSDYYWGFAVGRLLMATGSTGSTLCAYVLLTEFLDSGLRGTFGALWHVCFSLGYCTVAVAAYFMRDYRTYQMLTTWPLLVFYIYIVAVPESPRWLLSKGRVKDALKIIQNICMVNGRPVPDSLETQKDADEDSATISGSSMKKAGLQEDNGVVNAAYEHNGEEKKTDDTEKYAENIKENNPKKEESDVAAVTENKATLLDLFRTPTLRKTTIIVFFTWFTNSLVYYGLSLNTGRLPGSVYVNTFLMGAIEIPANLLGMLFMNRLGRKWTVGGASGLAGISSLICIPLLFNSDYDEVVTGLAIFGKGAVTAAFAGIYLYTVEVFPTPIRNVGIGAASMCSRVSGMLAPFVGGPLEDIWKPLPSLIFGLTASLAGILMFTLPETLGKTLPDTLEEAEAFGRKKKKKSAAGEEEAGKVDLAMQHDDRDTRL